MLAERDITIASLQQSERQLVRQLESVARKLKVDSNRYEQRLAEERERVELIRQEATEYVH